MEMVKQLTPRTRASTEALCKPSSPLRLSISALRSSLSLFLSRITYTRLADPRVPPLVTRALIFPSLSLFISFFAHRASH